LVRDDCDLPLFLVVLRELLLAELIRGPEVLLALPRELLALLRAVFVAAFTLRLRESELLVRELADLFLPRLDRVLLDAALLPPVVDLMLADLAPLDTLAVLPPLLPRPLIVFIAASSLPNSLAT
jgi:hypothetical protein